MTELDYTYYSLYDPFAKPEETLKLYVEKKLKQIYPDIDYICDLQWSVSNYGKTYVQSKYCQGPSWIVESCYEPDQNKPSAEDCLYVLLHKVDSNNIVYDTLRFQSPLEASIALEWLLQGGF